MQRYAIAVLYWWLIVGAALAQAPFDLRCEHQVDPIAIDAETPRFSWKNAQDRQTAYRILVASSREKLVTDVGDLWDSGKVDSRQQQFVPYAGAALSFHQRGFWKVRAWNENDTPTPWSETARFAMGFLSPEDWQAQWVAGQDTAESQDSNTAMPIFRKVFSLDEKEVECATFHISGLGHFEASLNGSKVGDHELDPGWTDYEKTCLYVSFDVTGLLQSGDNTLGVMLGNGMYNVPGGRYTKFTGTFGEPRLIAELHIVYDDGSTQTIPTDSSWQTDAGPIVFSCVYGGEDYDARREQDGWNTAAFDASAWGAARVVDGPGGVLRAQTMPPITVKDTLQAVTIKKESEGSYCADLGLNLSMIPLSLIHI